MAMDTHPDGHADTHVRELPGQGPNREKVARLDDTAVGTLGPMSVTHRSTPAETPAPTSDAETGSSRIDLTKLLVSGKGHRLGHTPSATVGAVRTTNSVTSTPPGPIPLADGLVVDGILARLHRAGGVEEFTTQVRSARGCRRPVRLAGRVTAIGPTGLPEVRFDTSSLPDGVLLKACGSRRETVCPPCASLYRGDAFALVASGLRGGKGVPESIGDHPAVLLTLTAPSFGPVHRRRPDGTCHPTGTRCRHGRALVCGLRHAGSDRAVGQALCPDCYDYEGAVLFNAGVSELWRRTTIYALRALGSLLGLSSRQACRLLRLSYVKVAEFQKRGSVHLHALVRADLRHDEHGPAPADIDPTVLASALRIAAVKVSTPVPGSTTGARHVWGTQLDTTIVADAENGRARAAAYLAKYATKGTDEFGVLDHRLPAGICWDTRLPEHLRSLVVTAWELGGTGDLAEVGLQRWSHTCGFRGHFLTKSRRWSTTFGELRAERQRWRLAQRPDDQQAGLEESVVTAEWTFEGSGYMTVGDVCLARTVEDQLRLGRFVAREGSRLADGNDVGS